MGGEKSTIRIGNNVFIGMNVCMTTIGHKVGIPMQRAGENTYHDIVVGDGVWIGANVTILQGVTIGSGSIIAAGSLVRSDVKPNTLVAGVPAKEIKSF